MRRPTSAFAKAVLGTALAATTVSAQQTPPASPPGAGASEPAPVPSVNAARGARYLLRNGWDYITYQEYERALGFFREAESRQLELNDAERLRLAQGIERARRGLREATNGVNSGPAYARSGPHRRAGALALATPTPAPAPTAPAGTVPGPTPAVEREPIQLAGGGAASSGPGTVTTAVANGPGNVAPAVAPAPSPAPGIEPEPVPAVPLTPAPIPPPPDADPLALPTFTHEKAPAPTEPAPAPTASAPAPVPMPAPAEPVSTPAPAPAAPVPMPAPAPMDPAARPVGATVGAPAPAPVPAAPVPVAAPDPTPASAGGAPSLPDQPSSTEEIILPSLPGEPTPTPVAGPADAPPAAAVAAAPDPSAELPPTAPELPPLASEPDPARIASANTGDAPAPAPAPSATAEPSLDDASLPPLPPGLSGAPAADAPVATPTPEPPPAPAAETLMAPSPAPAAATPAPAPAAATPAPVSPDAGPSEAAGAEVGGAADVPDTPPPLRDATGPAGPSPRGRFGIDTLVPERSDTYKSTLTPELQREVDRIAAKQDEDMRRPAQPEALPPDANAEAPTSPAGPGGMASTRLEISRAPSPTEARPIRAIPVPEEFVPLPKREWDPNRKYWSAAATCHLPLYFQDASLERYGYSVEQHFGWFGRYLSVPIDDPRQSKQRNQIAQPFFSIGLFAAQIALLPYNMIMDPPWEAEYDLGYYRPGDRVPTDVFYLPLTGVGPPLRGSDYGNRPNRGVANSTSRW